MNNYTKDGFYWIHDKELNCDLVDFIDRETITSLYLQEYEILCFVGKNMEEFKELFGKPRE